MSQGAFDFNEFIEPKIQAEEEIEVVEEVEVSENEETEVSGDEIDGSENIDVQKAVVESLAADKAALDVELEALKKTLAEKEELLAEKEKEIVSFKEELSRKSLEISKLNDEMAKKESELADRFDSLYNTQDRNPNALALLDREVELPDRFPGETRDHILEVIKEARDKAEETGRRRRAQILESVLVANEPNGTLTERRSAIEQVLAESNNVITGKVIETLTELELSHKEGEEYLLASEILLRNF